MLVSSANDTASPEPSQDKDSVYFLSRGLWKFPQFSEWHRKIWSA